MIKNFAASIASIFLLSLFLPNVTYNSLVILIIAGLVLSLTQSFLRPILKVLLLPVTVITLGLFSGLVNVILLWLVVALVPGFHIDPMTVSGMKFTYFFTLIIVSFLLGVLQTLFKLLIGLLPWQK